MVLLHIWLVYGPPVHLVVDSISMYCSFVRTVHVYTMHTIEGGLSLHLLGVHYHVRPPLISFHRYSRAVAYLYIWHVVKRLLYIYMDHLLAFDACINPEPQSVKSLSSEVYSPLQLHQWM